MAQLSTDTLAYAQIISKVQKFIDDYSNLKNVSPKDYDKAYQELLFDIHTNIGGTMAKGVLMKMGDVPSSSMFNRLVSDLSSDINIITNQFDTLAANYINTFNMASNQIESEKSSLGRVRSKINVLELYSKSSSVNITYFGDSFNDLSNVQTDKITPGNIPDISDGYATLAKTRSKNLKTTIKIINENYNDQVSSEVSFAKSSNGLRGNYFLFHNDDEENMFLYEKNPYILKSNEQSMTDGSAATYFECEAIKVIDSENSLKPEYEFEYLSGDKYINWSKFDESKALTLTVELSASSKVGDYINSISILPFFGYDIQGANAVIKNVMVTSIKLFDESLNKTYELINSGPITIGSDISLRTIENYKNFFHNKGVFKFEEKKVNKIYITFEQLEFNESVIKHTFWTPYELGSPNKWANQERFNPSGLTSPANVVSSWDKNILVPNILTPAQHKSGSLINKQISIIESQSVGDSVKYQIRYMPEGMVTIGGNAFYWYKNDPDANMDYFCEKEKALKYTSREPLEATMQRIINGTPAIPCVLIDPSLNIVNQINSKKIKMLTVQNSLGFANITTQLEHKLLVNQSVYIKDRWGDNIDIIGVFKVAEIISPVEFRVQTSTQETIPITNIGQNFGLCLPVIGAPKASDISIETDTKKLFSNKKILLNLEKNSEYLKAKRASIGVRDISIAQESFLDTAEVISKPFFINGTLELISLEVSEYIPFSENGQASIDYHISVDNGVNYIRISPMHRQFKGIPEILAFNQNLSDNSTVPQIEYFNQPEVPNQINSIIFKAIFKKNKSVNSTPILYWYKLGARIT